MNKEGILLFVTCGFVILPLILALRPWRYFFSVLFLAYLVYLVLAVLFLLCLYAYAAIVMWIVIWPKEKRNEQHI